MIACSPELKATLFWILAVHLACSFLWWGSPTFFRISVRFLFFTLDLMLFAIASQSDERLVPAYTGCLSQQLAPLLCLAARPVQLGRNERGYSEMYSIGSTSQPLRAPLSPWLTVRPPHSLRPVWLYIILWNNNDIVVCGTGRSVSPSPQGSFYLRCLGDAAHSRLKRYGVYKSLGHVVISTYGRRIDPVWLFFARGRLNLPIFFLTKIGVIVKPCLDTIFKNALSDVETCRRLWAIHLGERSSPDDSSGVEFPKSSEQCAPALA